MGQIYRQTIDFFNHSIPKQKIIEIGSDRYEGSTAFFAEQATQFDLTLDTVDIDGECASRIRRNTISEHLGKIRFYQQDGSEFARNYHGPEIHTLYLDNFDWDWEPGNPNRMIDEQRIWYALKGYTMTNDNCQQAHYVQMINLYNKMASDCVICIDDTYQLNNKWTGKGGTVVPFLLQNDYELLHYEDYGVILGRGKYTQKVQ